VVSCVGWLFHTKYRVVAQVATLALLQALSSVGCACGEYVLSQ
jgi:uncharacterized membrane protein YqjE